ncbi:MAG: nucleotide exchange factor GrpE [Alphaproteobacteria bacterium]|nr:nucleotide exchange factor GrpE [Alphaproteobacteria bacterium]
MEDASDDAPFDAGEVLNAQVEELERQLADLTGRLAKAQEDIHRHQAEIQNLHRRREKETEEASKYAIAKFARDVVEVSDNFERAISSVPAEATHDNPVLKSLLDGVTMTERAFLGVLENHGVKRISPKDEMFDPHRHQAVMEKEDKAVPSGTVLQVYQPGYIIADRVLRPAMVVVARGGPKPVKPAPATEAAPDPAAGEAGRPETGSGVDSGDDAPKTGSDNN